MKRRSKEISGWVNFPVNNTEWMETHEGGMLVKLVVCDNRDFDNQFGVCCGASVIDVLSECLVGDDRRPKQKVFVDDESIEPWQAQADANCKWEAYHFPHSNDDSVDGADKYLSRGYLTVVVLGTTGWSGFNETIGEYWKCSFDDLTEDGKQLYKQFEKLYPGCELHLLTFLDT